MARFLCTGDSHLGSGADLGRVPGERLEEQEHVWRQTLSLARTSECDAVLHGGDLFHRASPSPEEGLAALRPLVEHAAEGGCPVVMCIGNHERRGVSEATMPAALSELDVLHVSQSPEVAGDFGGVAVYRTTFDAPDASLDVLDLGTVDGISEVLLNGQPLGVRWYGRHRYAVGGALRPGRNELEVRVSTVLANHMRAQQDNGSARRWAWWAPAIPMGLLGPVTLARIQTK